MESPLLGADLDKMWPLIPHGQSDTACLDNALELLVAGGYRLAHAMMMLIPEAWAGNQNDGRQAPRLLRISRRPDGAVGRPCRRGLHRRPPDRRDAGPQRPAPRPLLVTDDDHVIMASESGVLPIKEEKIVRKWRLQPGKMLLIDLDRAASSRTKRSRRSLPQAAL
jgi:glutamate synthase (NADPH/NADH) large chain